MLFDHLFISQAILRTKTFNGASIINWRLPTILLHPVINLVIFKNALSACSFWNEYFVTIENEYTPLYDQR